MKSKELWTRHEIKKEEEKRIIVGMITDTEYLRQISSFLKLELLELSYVRKVAQMCLKYLDMTSQAPRGNIEDMYQQSLSLGKIEQGEASLIETFLSGLSKEYVESREKFNTDYEISQAKEYLKRRSLLDLVHKTKERIAVNDLKEAENFIANYNEVGNNILQCDNILEDEEVMRSCFVQDDVLFKFPGVLGNMMGWFKRGDFISFTAPPKRGKSWWLMETAVKGFMMGYKVLFINLEMSRKEIIRRFYQRLLGEVGFWEEDKTVLIPYYNEYNEIGYKEKQKKGLKPDEVVKKMKALKSHIRTGGLRILNECSGGVSIEDIYIALDNLRYFENFTSDVIIIDYADLMYCRKKYKDERDHINIIWRDLRGLAQKRNCLVVTASHSNRSTLNKESIGQSDIVEDIRKLNHVTSMFALNQTNQEKEENVMRIGSLGVRGSSFSLTKEVQVIYQLKIGRPYIDSRWVKFKDNQKKLKKK